MVTMTRRRPLGEEYFPPLLRVLYQAFIDRVHVELAAAGYPEFRPTHGLVFQHLRDEGSRVTDLAERSHISKQWMGALVDDLVARGYVSRLPDPTDGRARIVRLTDEGRALLRVAQDISRRIEAEWAAQVGERHWHQLRRGLEDAILRLGLSAPSTERHVPPASRRIGDGMTPSAS